MIIRKAFLSPTLFRQTVSQIRTMSSRPITFGPFVVTDQVFYRTSLSYALVNIKPIVPGHVLIIPYRPVPRLTDLTTAEVTDLFTTVQKVQKMLAAVYFHPSSTSPDPTSLSSPPSSIPSSMADALRLGSFNVAIQDGPESGQSVPHVHCHIIPRLKGNTEGDGIYDRLQSEEGNVGGGLWDLRERPEVGERFPKIEEEGRKVRAVEVMNEEARVYGEWMRLFDEDKTPCSSSVPYGK